MFADQIWLNMEKDEPHSHLCSVPREKLPIFYPMTESRGIKIFLAHASDDKTRVLALYERLKDQGYDPWLDKKNLLPGQNWRTEIPKVIKSCDVFIACFSPRSVNKDGYIQKELRLALMECAEKPSDRLYLIPLRLESCEIPDMQLPHLGVNLQDYHWLDYWEPDSFEVLIKAIEYGRESSPLLSLSTDIPANISSSSTAPKILSSLALSLSPDVPSETATDKLLKFSFEVLTVDSWGLETGRKIEHARHYQEILEHNLFLDMVHIPGGEFMMGAPEDEPFRHDSEGPQHLVSVPEFFLGRYPVTQVQWLFVASLEQINRQLKPNPSDWKGANFPVEGVSWLESVEFCDRLTRLTGKHYHLPSEAQWEYACRAGSSTPFNFGFTLTSEIANYCDQYTYSGNSTGGTATIGEYRMETTEVGQFPANSFGLSDMHGNVWEWCQDHWHATYADAPTDGNVWLNENDTHSYRLRRGGSWIDYPWNCRAAYRDYTPMDVHSYVLGFRVACSFPRK